MRVLLRNTQTGLYYAGDNQWTSEAPEAMNLVDLDHAAQLAREGSVTDAEVILSYNNPICQLSLPVRPEWYGDWTGRAAA